MNRHVLERVSEEAEVADVVGQLRLLVRPTQVGFALLRKDGWVAIPAESSLHLSNMDQHQLLKAFGDAGFQWVYAVAFEKLEHIAPVLRVEVSVAGLTAFNRECAHFNYVICPADMTSLVVCSTSGDFLAFAGRPEFVVTATGRPLSDARSAFEEFANDPAWTPRQKSYFSSLLTTLCDEYSTAEAGQWVTFSEAAES